MTYVASLICGGHPGQHMRCHKTRLAVPAPPPTGASPPDHRGEESRALAGPERQIILDVLEANGWNRNATAEELGINRTTLYKKMKRLGLEETRLFAGFWVWKKPVFSRAIYCRSA